MSHSMKKLMSLSILLIVSLTLFAGCGEKEKETQKIETKVVKTEQGNINIPVNLTRVVIQSYVGDILSLGIKPIGGDMDPTLFDGLLDHSEYQKLDNFDPETVMALEPDLIIIQVRNKTTDYDRLSLIAPTIVLNDIDMTTEERIQYLGALLGKEEEAKEAIHAYAALANESKQKLVTAGIENKTITIMEGSYLFGEKYGRGADIVYNFLGFTAPEKLQNEFDAGKFYMEVSMEVLHEYCGDYILRSVYEGAEDLSENEVFNNINAVKSGNVIEIDFDQFYARDIYVMSKQMNYITDALLATVE